MAEAEATEARARKLISLLVKGGVRDVGEEMQLIADFVTWRRAEPRAGIVAGTLFIPPDAENFTIDLGAVDFGPVHWVALADCSLEHAVRKLSVMVDPPADLIAAIERARAALDFADPEGALQ